MATHLPTSMRVFIVMAFTIGTVPPWAHAVKYAFVNKRRLRTAASTRPASAPGIASANAICTRCSEFSGVDHPRPEPSRALARLALRRSKLPLDDIYTGNGRLPPTRRQRPDCGKLVRVNKRDAPSPPQHGRTRHPPTTGCLDGQPEYLNPGQYHMWAVGPPGRRPSAYKERSASPPPHESGRTPGKRLRNATHLCSVSSRGQSQWN